jgi:hypothetical protein
MSTQPNIIKYKDWDPKKTEFIKPKSTKSNSNSSFYASYNGQRPYIQTPQMRLPFGLSIEDPTKWGGNDKGNSELRYRLEPSFSGMQGYKDGTNEGLKIFYDKMLAFDEHVANRALKDNWFDDNDIDSEKLVKKFYYPCVKDPRNKKTKDKKKVVDYPPTIRYKLTLNKDSSGTDKVVFNCEFYDAKKHEIQDPFKYITKGSSMVGIVECSGAQIISGRLSVTWRLHQVIIFANDQPRLQSLAFIPDSDDENDPAESTGKNNGTLIDDDDDSNDDNVVVKNKKPTSSSSSDDNKKKREDDKKKVKTKDNDSDNDDNDNDNDMHETKNTKKDSKEAKKTKKH